MKNTHTKPPIFAEFSIRPHLRRKSLTLVAIIIIVLAAGTFLAACGTDPVETQETTLPTFPISDAYAKILAIEGAEKYDPAILEAFAQRIEEDEGFLEIYTEDWTLEQDGTRTCLTCVASLTDDYKRSTFKLIHDGKTLYVDALTKEEYPDAYTKNLHLILCSAKGWNESSDRVKKDFLELLLSCDWFPGSTEWDQYKTNWYYEILPLPDGAEDERYVTLFIELREADSAPDDPYLLCSVYHDGNNAMERAVEEIDPYVEFTVPPTTEPVPTEPTVPFDYESSSAYQKLLTLPNADEFICNRFGNNLLAMFAQWIDSLEGVMETYSGRWYLKHYGDDGSALFCHSPLEADNSCDYMRFFIWYGGDIITDPSTGRRYFTDVPREVFADLIYGACDPVGVDDKIKELMIEETLISEYFAWNVTDPSFRILDSYYEIRRNWPYPEQEPDNYTDDIYLIFHVWRPGMAEDEYIKCWLTYREELSRVFFGLDGADEYWLSGIIPKN